MDEFFNKSLNKNEKNFNISGIKYIDKGYNMMVNHGASFEDIDTIFIGNSEIQFIE